MDFGRFNSLVNFYAGREVGSISDVSDKLKPKRQGTFMEMVKVLETLSVRKSNESFLRSELLGSGSVNEFIGVYVWNSGSGRARRYSEFIEDALGMRARLIGTVHAVREKGWHKIVSDHVIFDYRGANYDVVFLREAKSI